MRSTISATPAQNPALTMSESNNPETAPQFTRRPFFLLFQSESSLSQRRKSLFPEDPYERLQGSTVVFVGMTLVLTWGENRNTFTFKKHLL